MKINQLKEIAKESALLSITTKHYIKFMQIRFPKEKDENYAGEWAERFAHQTDWIFADGKSKKILVKIKYRTPKGNLRPFRD